MKYARLPLLGILIALLALEASAKCNKTLRIGINETLWPPYISRKEGKAFGLEINALNILFIDSIYCLEYVFYPTSTRMLAELKVGNVDVLIAATKTTTRDKFAYFTTPYRQEVMALFQHKEKPKIGGEVESLILAGNTFALNAGSYYGMAFEKLIQDFYNDQLVHLPNATRRFKMLSKQRVDYVVEDKLAGDHIIKIKEYTDIIYSGTDANKTPVSYMLSKASLTTVDLENINQLIKVHQNELSNLFSFHQVSDPHL
ncbi:MULTISPECIES: substrate-binding periplasmic protein [Pseudoalteromonas]|uniref:substrate-binding periplasmic protein n=1 Tax=Pseudoalteromonas TaxID=53246 RepID=UPI000FFEB821|nr:MULTISPECIES: transporter substrate-binding domain-containing protein [Pseudoalteromonas]MCG9760008.1 transporter substrate-binding domain-containing protein [Pseudoalteromonas sp. Isolate6]NKC18232.1 transporter substrate-binding domain-containing protein [Pseudoalteromonas galatheae]RXE85261.1 amino acid ABC transporter substrate-binding protein [Pseudoalteromonas sp. A757]